MNPKIRCIRAMIFIGLATESVPAVIAQGQDHTYSVCEAIDSRVKLAGKAVTLRGIARAGPHGWWLVDEDPTHGSFSCQAGMASVDLTIDVKLDDSGNEIYTEDVAELFRTFNGALDEARLRQRPERTVDLLVTLTGRFEGREKFRLARNGVALSGNGFGHMGVHPAMLAITELKSTQYKES